MSFQFCCPQGHVLQGDESQVGQLFQCPMCGSRFLVPPPTVGPVAAGGFFQAPGTWPASAPQPSFPGDHDYMVPGPIPGMMPPQTMPMMPGGPMPAGPYPAPAAQPFAFGPGEVYPLAADRAAAVPAETSQQVPPTETASETEKPRFDLGFDPHAKESLPFEIPGQSEAEAGQTAAAPLPAPLLPAPLFPAASFPHDSFPANFPAPAMPLPPFEPSTGGQDFLESAPVVSEEAAELPANAQSPPPKVLHIRCPTGHLVTARSDLLGKQGRCPACKKTFELRYEDSLEFQRRKEHILHREEIETSRAWVAWAFLAAFLLFVGLAGLLLYLNR